MIALFFDHLENAYQSLRRNRARSALTTLGITIGIASVTCILALSSGVSYMIHQQVDDYDGRLAIIRPGLQTRDPNAITNPIAQQTFSTSTLTEQDVAKISEVEGVEVAVPIMTIDGTLRSTTDTVKNNVVLATTPDFVKVANITMKSGQFLDETTDNSTAVVGEGLAVELFGTNKPISRTFTIREQQFTVIGVITRTENPINYNNVDLNHAAVVSFAQGKQFHQGRAQIQQINVRVNDSALIADVTSRIDEVLLANHQGEKDFTIVSGEAIAQPTNQLFIALTQVMTAIAAISLFVGGIGIMNIMLVGVAERTREIGIRKAVGASNGNIVTQFLIEALMMSVLGGLLGYFVGYVVAYVISTFLYFTPTFTWLTAAVAAGMALGVGVIFGLFPAIKAARKDTIESLRQYH
ncbi:FtsX-like permease family protein [Candidatus Saccharibacteria bacterium]|nr:FtsX-like permease family protein [Candidatus Saccharibacteria bacterium]